MNYRKVLSPRQRLGVFNAQPSRHARSQGGQACSKTEKIVRMDQKWTKRQNERSPAMAHYIVLHAPASRKMNLSPLNIQATICAMHDFMIQRLFSVYAPQQWQYCRQYGSYFTCFSEIRLL